MRLRESMGQTVVQEKRVTRQCTSMGVGRKENLLSRKGLPPFPSPLHPPMGKGNSTVALPGGGGDTAGFQDHPSYINPPPPPPHHAPSVLTTKPWIQKTNCQLKSWQQLPATVLCTTVRHSPGYNSQPQSWLQLSATVLATTVSHSPGYNCQPPTWAQLSATVLGTTVSHSPGYNCQPQI
jgi:hypothetical protein